MNIAIVFGGKSVEHDVSIVTAKQIHNICKDMYDTTLIYVDKNGQLNLYKNHKFNFEDFKNKNRYFVPITINKGCVCNQTTLGLKKLHKIDCAIMCTHGGDGENGTLSSYFITAQIPVTAGSSVALGISMDKWLSKQFFKANKIMCAKGIFADAKTSIDQLDNKIIKTFGYPVIVKPNNGGSSIGIKTANNKTQLKHALDIALEFDNSAVIEQKLQNFTEFNCAVFGDGENLQISKIDEPIKTDQILSFSDKYLNKDNSKCQKSSMKTQARKYPELEPWLRQKIQKTSNEIFKRLGFWGVVRIDYIYTPQNKKLYVNEINAIPGSLASYFFANSKLEYNLFIEKLVNIGVKNYAKYANINKNFITKLF